MAFLRFYAAEADFQLFRQTLKLLHCPHCRRAGTLNCHGFLTGYTEDGGTNRQRRGHRIYCSNRHLRCGCGRTCSVLLCGCLKRFLITLKTLWAFIAAVVKGTSKKTAFTDCCPGMHPSAAYRLYRPIERAQSRLRSRLLRHTPVPPPPASAHPLAATLAHLRTAFPSSSCPFAAYQLIFQVPLL